MNDLQDLCVLIDSSVPIISIESREEKKVLSMIEAATSSRNISLFTWSISQGLVRQGIEEPQARYNNKPSEALMHIKTVNVSAVYVFLDFMPFLNDPLNVRLIKEMSGQDEGPRKTFVFLSQEVDLPSELNFLSAKFCPAHPGEAEIKKILSSLTAEWAETHKGQLVKADRRSVELLIRALSGLSEPDIWRLGRNAIFDDGVINQSDVEEIQKTKYELLGEDGALFFEYGTEKFSSVAGLENLKKWVTLRKDVFYGRGEKLNLDPPKGMLLLGVQGCGKSLAAKAVSGLFEVPLLRLSFGLLYNKYIGESEKTLERSLKKAELMSPCVLWLDEMEKGVATGEADGGTSKRILGMFLTWLSEHKSKVFVVATANDIVSLPPELVRKGRFDEIFFVDLPNEVQRIEIFAIHLNKRSLDPKTFNLQSLAKLSEGFSGAEIEQAIVSAIYSSLGQGLDLLEDGSDGASEKGQDLLEQELQNTKPLSVVMSEEISKLRTWAKGRTVQA